MGTLRIEGKLREAALEWLRRQERQSRPRGTVDLAGRWWPEPEEQAACCVGAGSPTRLNPYKLLNHCRTARHVATLYGVDERQLRNAARYLKREVIR